MKAGWYSQDDDTDYGGCIVQESEARLNLLRQRAESRYKQLDDSSASTDGAVVKKPPEHVVLFGSVRKAKA